MKYSILGNTESKISRICLGTMTWGHQNTELEAFEQMDFALSKGVNFWDTAEMYPVPPNANSYDQTEITIGNWLASRNLDSTTFNIKIYTFCNLCGCLYWIFYYYN